MTVFRYRAVASDGQLVHGEIDAVSREAALEKLQTSGHYPIAAKKASGWIDLRSHFAKLYEWRSRVRHADVAALTRELATLLNAGVTLDASLRMIESHCAHPKLKRILKRLHDDVQSGQAFSVALSQHRRVFSPLYISLAQAGEISGSLYTTLLRLADYLERVQAIRASIVSALAYPSILLVAAALSLFGLMSFVVPQFIPLFSDAGATLPVLTRLVFFGSEFLQRFWWVLLLVGGLCLYGFQRWVKERHNRTRVDRWMLALPVIGKLTRRLEVARFTRTLGTLTENGVPLLMGLRHARAVIGNEIIRQDIDACIESVEAGRGLGRTLEGSHLPTMAIELIVVGEETGQLDEMLLKVAAIYDEQAQVALTRLLTLAEPTLILGLGGIIALIIISILMAMLGLNELVG